MRLLVPILLLLLTCVFVSAEDARVYKVTYHGGSLTDFQAGEHMRLNVYQGRLRIFKDDATLMDLNPLAILAVASGEDLHRVGMAVGAANVAHGVTGVLAVRKGHKRFLGLAWDREGVKGSAVFEIDPKIAESATNELQQFSGKHVVNADAEVTTQEH